MSPNDPPIIKSGSRHTVQVAQGTKNAKSVRNQVTSDVDAPLKDRIVYVDENVQREAAQLKQGVTQEQQVGTGSGEHRVASEASESGETSFFSEDTSHGAGQVLAGEEPRQAGAAPQGPIIVQEVRADQDASAAKQAVAPEHRILIDEGASSTETLVSEPSPPQPLDNRQRIEQLQAKANRIRLENDIQATGQGQHAQAGSRTLLEHEISPAAPSDQRPQPPVAEEPSVQAEEPVSPAPAAALPPEVAANLGVEQDALVAKESALMARLRALKSNISVTENRLTQQLKAPDSSDD